MAAGFRKSFLGYNCDDVLKYIEKTTHENSEREIIDKEKINELSNTVTELENKNSELSAKLEELNGKLAEFEAKSDEIKKLSEGIGKLYLISKTNAQSIINAANESSNAVLEQVKKNIEIIDNAHNELFNIKTSVENNAASFSGNIDDLGASLSRVKEDIKNNTENIETRNNEFTSVVANS